MSPELCPAQYVFSDLIPQGQGQTTTTEHPLSWQDLSIPGSGGPWAGGSREAVVWINFSAIAKFV